MSLVDFIHRHTMPAQPVAGYFYWIDGENDNPQIWFAPTENKDEMLLLNDDEKIQELLSIIMGLESDLDSVQDSLKYDTVPTEGSQNLVKSGDLYNTFVENELIAAEAFNDLNTRLKRLKTDLTTNVNIINGNIDDLEERMDAIQDSFTYDSIPTEGSQNLVKSGDLYRVMTENEYVAAAAFNDLNRRLINIKKDIMDGIDIISYFDDSDFDRIAEKVNDKAFELTWTVI